MLGVVSSNLITRSIFQVPRSKDRVPSDCFHGSRFLNLGYHFHPFVFDVEVIAFSIALAYAFGCPTAYGIYDVGGAFNGPETVSEAVAEGVDHTSLWQSWLEPLVEGRTGRVGITLLYVAVFGEGKLCSLDLDLFCCPQRCAY